jgi:hypothetical protein
LRLIASFAIRTGSAVPSSAAAFLLAAAIALFTPALGAQSVAVSGDPGLLSVHSATPGASLDPVSNAATTLAVTTTKPNQKIVARLDAPLPDGITLTIQLGAPDGSLSRGQVRLATTDQELVGGIPTTGTHPGLAIVYTLDATVGAGPLPATARTVVISVVDGT